MGDKENLHSAAYFGETRDYWWNADFLELLAHRWRLAEARSVLDVGCGAGHWGRTLGRFVAEDAHIVGVDREAGWVEAAQRAATERGIDHIFEYRQGIAESLPFPDNTFDLVTCQTVLIHVADPEAVVREMMRVTKPRGRIAVAEPNNVSGMLLLDSAGFAAPPERVLGLVRFLFLCERGKAAVGEGHNSIGEMIPGIFAAAGLQNVSVFMNDKTSTVLPPYETPEEKAIIAEIAEHDRVDRWVWDRSETRRFFLAGGGREDEFDDLWEMMRAQRREALKAIAARTYSTAGGALCYCASGLKPGD